MKNKRNFLIGLLTVVLVILTSCENPADDSSPTSDNQVQKNESAQNANEESPEKVDTIEEDISTEDKESLKEEYLKKLNETKREWDEIRENSKDEITYALKTIEGDRYDVWDGLLNEIYGVLKEQLTPKEMDQLRTEQREWIKYRDQSAKEASLKYEGGTQEHLEYVIVLNNLTEERCFELVEEYME
ncbi:hypothetical protein GCM10008967_09720 [Bacillus carboniphilus]|uniref:Lysozyme inhibitor LprI-like N-terminal domain-containing protein n=1 Tax=Bacillus carboniphilus TaxID=86663 RepID=A0ABN0VZJ1_9BACI